eukprot:scaffold259520_cov35-Tisochrysis_lutea.AAC.5
MSFRRSSGSLWSFFISTDPKAYDLCEVRRRCVPTVGVGGEKFGRVGPLPKRHERKGNDPGPMAPRRAHCAQL